MYGRKLSAQSLLHPHTSARGAHADSPEVQTNDTARNRSRESFPNDVLSGGTRRFLTTVAQNIHEPEISELGLRKDAIYSVEIEQRYKRSVAGRGEVQDDAREGRGCDLG